MSICLCFKRQAVKALILFPGLLDGSKVKIMISCEGPIMIGSSTKSTGYYAWSWIFHSLFSSFFHRMSVILRRRGSRSRDRRRQSPPPADWRGPAEGWRPPQEWAGHCGGIGGRKGGPGHQGHQGGFERIMVDQIIMNHLQDVHVLF